MRPYDSRMWCAIAGCYEEMGREADAIKCYERASGLQDRDGQATVKLARMYKERGDDGSAYKHYAALLEMQEREEVSLVVACVRVVGVPTCYADTRACILVAPLRRLVVALRHARRWCFSPRTRRSTASLTWQSHTRRGFSHTRRRRRRRPYCVRFAASSSPARMGPSPQKPCSRWASLLRPDAAVGAQAVALQAQGPRRRHS